MAALPGGGPEGGRVGSIDLGCSSSTLALGSIDLRVLFQTWVWVTDLKRASETRLGEGILLEIVSRL